MISLTVPTTRDDRSLVIEMAADYVEEYLHEHGTLPPSPLLTLDTLPLIIRRNGRPVGLMSMATGDAEDGSERSEIDTVYLMPRYRGRGYASAAVIEFAVFAPHHPYLRGPLDDVMAHIAQELEIPTGDHHDLCSLGMVTTAFLNTVNCTHTRMIQKRHEDDPCRNCVHTEARKHFTKTYDLLAERIEGVSAP